MSDFRALLFGTADGNTDVTDTGNWGDNYDFLFSESPDDDAHITWNNVRDNSSASLKMRVPPPKGRAPLRDADGYATFDSRLFRTWVIIRKLSGGEPIFLSSAVRDFVPNDPDAVKSSSHMRGNAFDILLTPEQLVKLRANLPQLLDTAPVGGLGVASWGVHVDTEIEKAENYWMIPGKPASYRVRHWAEDNEPLWMVCLGTSQTGKSPIKDDGSGLERKLDMQFHGSDNWWIWILGIIAVLLVFFRKKIR